MTSPRRFEQDLPALLADMYLSGTPIYRDDLVQQMAGVRQRPAWTFPERWLPVDLVTTRVPTTRLPLRQLALVALLAALLGAALAFYAGSRQEPLPAPFGPAANGLIAYSHQGDIHLADPSTGVATAVVTGPETDLRPVFAPDGSKFVFERKVEAGGGQGHLYVARSDGTGLIQATIEPLHLVASQVGDPYRFSPDGRSLVVAARRGNDGPALFIVAADGSGDRELDLAALDDRVTTVAQATFRPPDGKEILFVGTDHDPSNGGSGLYAVNASGGGIRTIVEADSTHELDLGTWSPDGQSISYAMWDITANGLTVRTHIIRADGTEDRVLPMPEGAVWDLGAAWSNDGTRLHIVRGYTPGFEDSRPVIVPVDGSGVGTEIPTQGPIQQNCCYSWEWSPDDTMIIGRPIDAGGSPMQQVVIDVATQSIRPAPWTTSEDSAIQRRAR